MGQDKALLSFQGKPLIARIADRFTHMAQEILVITNRPKDYAFLGLQIINDLFPNDGALGGLYTALDAAQLPIVAMIACDMPFANPELISAEADLLIQTGADVVIPRGSKGLEPMHAVYRAQTCLPAVIAAFKRDERRLVSWFSTVSVREMSLGEITRYDPEESAFVNINTPEDFRLAEAIANRNGR